MNEHRQLIPRYTVKDKYDVIIIIDGSKAVSPQDFMKEKKMCYALAANLEHAYQFGLVQFGSQAKIQLHLTPDRAELANKIEAMDQIGGKENLIEGLHLCVQVFELSRAPNIMKKVWIVTDGRFEDIDNISLAAHKIMLTMKASFFAVGISSFASKGVLDSIASTGQAFESFNQYKDIHGKNKHWQDLSSVCQVEATLRLPRGLPLKLGEKAELTIEVKNVGKALPSQSCLIIHSNAYFNEHKTVIPRKLKSGESSAITITLSPKILSNKTSQLLALPEVLELSLIDPDHNLVVCDVDGLFLSHETFVGDFYAHQSPHTNMNPFANILMFGPPGTGKSLFVNDVISALSSGITKVNQTGETRNFVTTTSLLCFPLDKIIHNTLTIHLYDMPGKMFNDETLEFLLYGLLRRGTDFRELLAHPLSPIQNWRDPKEIENNRRIHVVAFFVPYDAISDDAIMRTLAESLRQITTKHKRKAIVVCSHDKEILQGETEEHSNKISDKLKINADSVFFFKINSERNAKQFHHDKNVLRILLALLGGVDDFCVGDKLLAEAEQNTLDLILEKIQQPLRGKVAQSMKEEEIEDGETLGRITLEMWRMLGYKMGEIAKIMNAVQKTIG